MINLLKKHNLWDFLTGREQMILETFKPPGSGIDDQLIKISLDVTMRVCHDLLRDHGITETCEHP